MDVANISRKSEKFNVCNLGPQVQILYERVMKYFIKPHEKM